MNVVNYGGFFPRRTRPKQEFSKFRDVYEVVHTANGNKEFIKISSTDMHALAQSHKDACSIENIIKRATNDPTVLQRHVGSYMDLTKVPTNMHDAQVIINEAKQTFDNLPQDTKDAYNNSFSTFLGEFKTAVGLAKFVKQMQLKKTEVKEVTENA